MRKIGRNIKMELLSQDADIVELIFAGKKTQRASRLFLNELKNKNGLSRAEFNDFTVQLHNGKVKQAPGFRYCRSQFYTNVRRTFLLLGLINVVERATGNEVLEKYSSILQPIPKRAPDGLNLPHICWLISKKWNDEFSLTSYKETNHLEEE